MKNIKLGFDPTAPDLHLGHAVVLKKAKEYQDLGHNVIVIIGDFTAQIGDPTGKSKTRPILTKEEIDRNIETYLSQLGKILNLNKTTIRRNSEWLSKLSLSDIISLMATSTVAQMMERNDFSNRYSENQPISLHEFLYPLLQAYDSLEIKADVEIGGTDQLFNIMAGRKLQEARGQKGQEAVLLPILTGLDGTQKMSKSLGNYIGLNEVPNDMFGKVMSIPDSLLGEYSKLVVPTTETEPVLIKKHIAQNIVTQYHGEEAGLLALKHWNEVIVGKSLPEMQTIKTTETNIAKILFENGLIKSIGEGKRLKEQGGIKFSKDGTTWNDNFELPCIVRYGKRRYMRCEK